MPPMDPDPYSTAITAVCEALRLGMDNQGGMSDDEYDTLVSLFAVIADRDPQAAGQFSGRSSCLRSAGPACTVWAMRYPLVPNKPRPLSTVHVGVAPGSDARWRGVRPSKKLQVRSMARVQEQQLRDR